MNLYKVNSKTKEKVLVGNWNRDSRTIEFLEPIRDISSLDMNEINTYDIDYELEELEICLYDIRDLLIPIKDKNNDRYTDYLSLGYFDNGILIIWDQYVT